LARGSRITPLCSGNITGILSAFFLIGVVLAMGISVDDGSNGFMVPIAWAVVQSLGIKPAAEGPRSSS